MYCIKITIFFEVTTKKITNKKTISIKGVISTVKDLSFRLLNFIFYIESLRKFAKSLKIENFKTLSIGKLKAEIFESEVEDKLSEPTFIYKYPLEISPLSRKSEGDEGYVDRFELFIDGKEIANGFSELNDPEDQLERFKMQMEDKEKGDEEAMEMDLDYIEALEYGLAPCAGVGIGLDRLVMLLTGIDSIRDVILFPQLKNKGN